MWSRAHHLISCSNQYEPIDCVERQLSNSTLDHSHKSSSWRVPRLPRFTQKTLLLFIADLVLFGLILHILSPLISLLRHNKELFPAHASIANSDFPGSFEPQDHQIPWILHQTTKNETIPNIWAESQASCLKTYSNYEYMLWTDNRARSFLAAEYPWFLDVWDNYPFPIQRADAIRYFVLYHYGGIYLDMDTMCHETFPIDQIKSKNVTHNCLFQATLPTGVTNDIMISSAKHPAFERATKLLPVSYRLTWWWAKLQPYAAIMSSTGPLFISLALADYLYDQSSLPSPTVRVVSPSGLKPYISDLQTATWHGWDAHILKWLSNKPSVWFILGTVLVVGGLYTVNKIFVIASRMLLRLIQASIQRIQRMAKTI